MINVIGLYNNPDVLSMLQKIFTTTTTVAATEQVLFVLHLQKICSHPYFVNNCYLRQLVTLLNKEKGEICRTDGRGELLFFAHHFKCKGEDFDKLN